MDEEKAGNTDCGRHASSDVASTPAGNASADSVPAGGTSADGTSAGADRGMTADSVDPTGTGATPSGAIEETTCRAESRTAASYHDRLQALTDVIIRDCSTEDCHTHVGFEPIPTREAVVEIIDRARELLFPGFFSRSRVDPMNARFVIGQVAITLFDLLAAQITASIKHECLRFERPCSNCEDRAFQAALDLIADIPTIRRVLADDIRATFEGDPAAQSTDEIVYSYPGLQAIAVYRLAHKLHQLHVPMLPRMMTERMHSVTGIDIHPAAEIGSGFVIDHGTGVVIGETCHIGKDVRIYQGVTLGALSLPKGAGDHYRGAKRHPTIEDDVIIYSGATILGGDTVIGARSVIGGNVWLTESVPPDTVVMIETPALIKKSKNS
jgi:serine O-acetyltransferase